MPVEETYPLTMGQLSMWSDLQVCPPQQMWESNLEVVWPAPPGVTADQVRDAIVALAVRHESLRTVYRPAHDPHQVRQVVLRDPEVCWSELPEREPFHLVEQPAWRAWVSADGDVPRVHLVIHHIAADGAALAVLESDFYSLLAGEPLAPAPTPRALAESQRGDRLRARLRTAGDYVARIVEEAPPTTIAERGPLVKACAHTGIPYAAAQRAAQHVQVTLSNLVLTAYARALATTTGTDSHLLWLLSANRLSPPVRRLVSSMTQWVPLIATSTPGAVTAADAHDVNVAALTALQHGTYDPFGVPPLDFDRGAFYMFLPPPATTGPENPITTATSTMEPPSVELIPPRGYSGASFYLVVDVYPQVRLTLRVMRVGYGQEQVVFFLETMTQLLRQVVGQSARGRTA